MWRNLLLAGDWTATGMPSTIEGAVRSGHRAARLIHQGADGVQSRNG
jgi:monoamine oxidase